MRIPPYWTRESYTATDARGRECTFAAWGWSFESAAAAREDARDRAKHAFERFTRGEKLDAYEYLEHPLREEIVDSLRQGDDEIALITRNRYGALVLNTKSVCFVDVDDPPAPARGLWDSIVSAFSSARRRRRSAAAREARIEEIRAWARRNPRRAFRVYRTCAGLRLLFVDRPYDPVSNEVSALLNELGSDRLYRKLTERQACFRARLTPKPWRCKCGTPPNRYPWNDADAERHYRDWQSGYEQKTRGLDVCALIETIGHDASDPTIRAVVDLHDRHACGSGNAPLA